MFKNGRKLIDLLLDRAQGFAGACCPMGSNLSSIGRFKLNEQLGEFFCAHSKRLEVAGINWEMAAMKLIEFGGSGEKFCEMGPEVGTLGGEEIGEGDAGGFVPWIIREVNFEGAIQDLRYSGAMRFKLFESDACDRDIAQAHVVGRRGKPFGGQVVKR